MGLQVLLVGRLRPDLGVSGTHEGVPVADVRSPEAVQDSVARLTGPAVAATVTNIALDMRRESAQAARRKAARTVPRVTLVVSMVLVPPTLLIIGVGLYLGSGVELGQVLGG